MKLLFVVLNTPDKMEEVLEGLVEAGVTGATVVDSEGMGHLLENVPLFAGLRFLFRSSKPKNKTLFSAIRDEQAAETMQILKKVLRCEEEKGRGVAFLLPVEQYIGLGSCTAP
jgi:nitrogen regulatory protein P-II 1